MSIVTYMYHRKILYITFALGSLQYLRSCVMILVIPVGTVAMEHILSLFMKDVKSGLRHFDWDFGLGITTPITLPKLP